MVIFYFLETLKGVLGSSTIHYCRWLGLNDNLFNSRLKEKRYYFCKDFGYGHDLQINRIENDCFEGQIVKT